MSHQTVVQAVPENPVTKTSCDWLLTGFIFRTEIGGVCVTIGKDGAAIQSHATLVS